MIGICTGEIHFGTVSAVRAKVNALSQKVRTGEDCQQHDTSDIKIIIVSPQNGTSYPITDVYSSTPPLSGYTSTFTICADIVGSNIDTVEFYVNDSRIWCTSEYPYSCVARLYFIQTMLYGTERTYTVTVTAYDKGIKTSSSIVVSAYWLK